MFVRIVLRTEYFLSVMHTVKTMETSRNFYPAVHVKPNSLGIKKKKNFIINSGYKCTQESFFQKIKIASEVIFEIAKFRSTFIVKYDESFFTVVLFCFNTYIATDISV